MNKADRLKCFIGGIIPLMVLLLFDEQGSKLYDWCLESLDQLLAPLYMELGPRNEIAPIDFSLNRLPGISSIPNPAISSEWKRPFIFAVMQFSCFIMSIGVWTYQFRVNTNDKRFPRSGLAFCYLVFAFYFLVLFILNGLSASRTMLAIFEILVRGRYGSWSDDLMMAREPDRLEAIGMLLSRDSIGPLLVAVSFVPISVYLFQLNSAQNEARHVARPFLGSRGGEGLDWGIAFAGLWFALTTTILFLFLTYHLALIGSLCLNTDIWSSTGRIGSFPYLPVLGDQLYSGLWPVVVLIESLGAIVLVWLVMMLVTVRPRIVGQTLLFHKGVYIFYILIASLDGLASRAIYPKNLGLIFVPILLSVIGIAIGHAFTKSGVLSESQVYS